MPICIRCDKMLSSKQALDKHMKSRLCVEIYRPDDAQLCAESYAVIRCSADGVVSDCNKKSPSYNTPPVRMFSVAGKSLYDVLSCDHDSKCCSSCKYQFAMKHIQLLSNQNTIHRISGVRVQDVISGVRDRKYDCVLAMKGDEMRVYLNITT